MTDGLVRLDPASASAPFDQVRGQLAARITDGRLVAGARLPTVRGLAEQLGISVNTVARAYRELETAGLIETRGRAGTVVSARGDVVRARLQAAAQRYAAQAHAAGINVDEALAIVRAALG
ncbi:GntR family transcriptional regulator [uncultured Jatrophihabitans sp.]|uniref:GntR family transcriptional regulator n=1 Tax=uncultured Jatrophihabitans sp. TaxID=1610747 RepID=UPI0035C993F3